MSFNLAKLGPGVPAVPATAVGAGAEPAWRDGASDLTPDAGLL